jgi:hypothetical protein
VADSVVSIKNIRQLTTAALSRVALALAAVAAVEVAAATYTSLTGGFQVDFGFLRVSSTDPWKPLTIGLLCACAAGWLLDRRTGFLSRSVSVPTAHVVAAVTLAVALIPLFIPLLRLDGFPFGHDVSAHATYTYLFDRALRQGQFPVRWVEWIQPGQGQPLFNHYQVGLYYLAEGLHRLVPSLSLSLKLTVVVFWSAGAAFMFLLFRRYGLWSGVAAAITLTWSEYLLLDAYVRAAYPELVAIGLAPAVLWSLDRFARTGRSAFLCAFTFASALLTVCHPPTALIVAPVYAMYVVYLAATGQATGWHLLRIVPAAALAAGLTAFFIWPALGEMEGIRIDTMAKTGLDYRDHFVFPSQWLESDWWYGQSIPGPGDQMPLRLSWIQMVVIAWSLVVVGMSVRTRRLTVRGAETMWWLTVVAFALFMSTHASAPVWEAVPYLAFLLFPWRYMMLVSIGVGALAAIAMSGLKDRATKALLIGCLILVQWYLTRDYRALTYKIPPVVMNIDDVDWDRSPNARRTAYLERAYDPASSIDAPPAIAARWLVTGGDGEIRERLVADHRLSLTARTPAGMRLRFHTRYVPGWVIRVDGHETPFTVDPKHGYMQVDIGPGRHEVDLTFVDTAIRRYANVLSLLSGVVWVGWTIVAIGGSRRSVLRAKLARARNASIRS